MSEIERWSIDRLSQSFASTREARSKSPTRVRAVHQRKTLAAATARILGYFSNWRKRHSRFARVG